MHLAFIPVDVILVSFVIEEFLNKRDKEAALKKFTMVFGVWLRRTGFDIFHALNNLLIDKEQNKIIFSEQNLSLKSIKRLKSLKFDMKCERKGILALKEILEEKSERLFNIATNPVFSELNHPSELIMILLHLHDEFLSRPSVKEMEKADLQHISDDIEKAYKAFLLSWVDYMDYLNENYPVLFQKNLEMLSKMKIIRR